MINLKAAAITAVMALSTPIAANALSITGFDSLGNDAVSGAGNMNALGTDLANVTVVGRTADAAGSVQFDFKLLVDAFFGTISVSLLPDGGLFFGVKDLVLETSFNGAPIDASTFTDSNGVATAAYETGQPQLILTLDAAKDDILSIVASYSGFASNNSRFDIGAQVQAIPLPASALLFLTALGGLGFVSRRRNVA